MTPERIPRRCGHFSCRHFCPSSLYVPHARFGRYYSRNSNRRRKRSPEYENLEWMNEERTDWQWSSCVTPEELIQLLRLLVASLHFGQHQSDFHGNEIHSFSPWMKMISKKLFSLSGSLCTSRHPSGADRSMVDCDERLWDGSKCKSWRDDEGLFWGDLEYPPEPREKIVLPENFCLNLVHPPPPSPPLSPRLCEGDVPSPHLLWHKRQRRWTSSPLSSLSGGYSGSEGKNSITSFPTSWDHISITIIFILFSLDDFRRSTLVDMIVLKYSDSDPRAKHWRSLLRLNIWTTVDWRYDSLFQWMDGRMHHGILSRISIRFGSRSRIMQNDPRTQSPATHFDSLLLFVSYETLMMISQDCEWDKSREWLNSWWDVSLLARHLVSPRHSFMHSCLDSDRLLFVLWTRHQVGHPKDGLIQDLN